MGAGTHWTVICFMENSDSEYLWPVVAHAHGGHMPDFPWGHSGRNSSHPRGRGDVPAVSTGNSCVQISLSYLINGCVTSAHHAASHSEKAPLQPLNDPRLGPLLIISSGLLTPLHFPMLRLLLSGSSALGSPFLSHSPCHTITLTSLSETLSCLSHTISMTHISVTHPYIVGETSFNSG